MSRTLPANCARFRPDHRTTLAGTGPSTGGRAAACNLSSRQTVEHTPPAPAYTAHDQSVVLHYSPSAAVTARSSAVHRSTASRRLLINNRPGRRLMQLCDGDTIVCCERARKRQPTAMRRSNTFKEPETSVPRLQCCCCCCCLWIPSYKTHDSMQEVYSNAIAVGETVDRW